MKRGAREREKKGEQERRGGKKEEEEKIGREAEKGGWVVERNN